MTDEQELLDRIKWLEAKVVQLSYWQKEQCALLLDVSFHAREDSVIIVATKLGGGRVNIINIHPKSFDQVIKFCKELKERFQPTFEVVDSPEVFRQLWREIGND